MSEVFRTLIVDAAQQAQAQAIAAAFAGGAGMFTTACSKGGAAPATAFISSGMLEEEIVAALEAVSGMDSSDEPPFTALARLGLQLLTDPSA